jgi:hypothetical protein
MNVALSSTSRTLLISCKLLLRQREVETRKKSLGCHLRAGLCDCGSPTPQWRLLLSTLPAMNCMCCGCAVRGGGVEPQLRRRENCRWVLRQGSHCDWAQPFAVQVRSPANIKMGRSLYGVGGGADPPYKRLHVAVLGERTVSFQIQVVSSVMGQARLHRLLDLAFALRARNI